MGAFLCPPWKSRPLAQKFTQIERDISTRVAKFRYRASASIAFILFPGSRNPPQHSRCERIGRQRASPRVARLFPERPALVSERVQKKCRDGSCDMFSSWRFRPGDVFFETRLNALRFYRLFGFFRNLSAPPLPPPPPPPLLRSRDGSDLSPAAARPYRLWLGAHLLFPPMP